MKRVFLGLLSHPHTTLHVCILPRQRCHDFLVLGCVAEEEMLLGNDPDNLSHLSGT